MRVFTLGDVHGDGLWFRHSITEAKRRDCDVILQVGDFGFWPHVREGRAFLELANRSLEDAGIDCWWIDGNHENFEALWEGDDPPPYPVWHTPRLCYLPRGTSWEWEGVTFVALGGAYSIDKHLRIPGVSWWPQETTRPRDVAKALSYGVCDVLVTHDAPSGTRMFEQGRLADHKQDDASRSNRQLVRAAMDGLGPQILVHGHWHLRNVESINGTTVLGLGRDGDPGAWAVLNVERGRVWVEEGRPAMPAVGT